VTVTSDRSTDLPDFSAPPLNEVVLGVQFSTPKGYLQIHAGRVWELYRSDYPEVQEHAPLPPSFETFGIPHQRMSMPQIRFDSGGSHDRFWFVEPSGTELIQFQQDRLLHNWRKVVGGNNTYPRYEAMVSRFKEELVRLQEFMGTLSSQKLQINQCEISYINHIVSKPNDDLSASHWLRFLNFDDVPPNDFSVSAREVIRGPDGSPRSRLTYEASTGVLANGDPLIAMTLAVRGAPPRGDIDSAIDFLSEGRRIIVTKFAKLTTEYAHKKWGRSQ